MSPEFGDREPDIRKAAIAIVRDRKLLVSRTKGKDIFVAPGGKREQDEETGEVETGKQAGIREIKEEQGLEVSEDQLDSIGVFRAVAAGHEDEQLIVEMEVFLLNDLNGEPTPAAEIEENKWVTSADVDKVSIGSIFAHDVIPVLVERDLID